MKSLYPVIALVFLLVGCDALWCQHPSPSPSAATVESPVGDRFCGSDLLARSIADAGRESAINRILYSVLDRAGKGARSHRSIAGDEMYTIPVVVHIIHNGGSENITDAQILAGIQHMNDAYANVGVYDPATGVNVGIEFCLVRRDPNGVFTTGITRTQSGMTDMTIETDDISLKNLVRWDPYHYLNIWLVGEIRSASVGSGVAGYAYFPSSHGMENDGIVGEARWFGSSTDNSKIFAHEAGHYLGLYHTFQGGCRNGDCLAEGDRVCDTPPDGTTIGVSCGVPVNSCATDADDRSANNPFRPSTDGGLGDQSDLYTDYMDYGRLECYTLFTQGQKERMRAVLTTIRESLLESKGCLSPCTSSVTAAFSASSLSVVSGTTVDFTNASIGAGAYEWRINDIVIATTTNASYTFNTQGRYVVVLRALNGDPSCTDEESVVIDVICPVRATFTTSSRAIQPGESVTFTNTSTGATTYQWLINGVPSGMSTDLQQTFPTSGGYRVVLVACSGICCDTSLGVFISVGTCLSSNRWNIWYFGYGAGLDFNSGQPVALTEGKLHAKDGTSTICDKDGNLLFYSDGDTVWNRRHQVMKNGTGLWGREAATQSATIVPLPGSDSLYYLLTVTDWWQRNTGIRYSIVDMSLDGGLGAITSEKNVPLRDNVSEEVALTMHANCRDVWIVTHEMNNSRFVSYLLTPSGIAPDPVITDVGPATGNAFPRFGYLKFSSNGTRLCNTLAASQTEPTVVLFDFDNSTGVVSNPIVLADDDELRYSYSSEFSLDGRYLYTTDLLKTVVWQYDLAAGDETAIHASKMLIASTRNEMGCFQMGPDGRIYVTSRWSPTISVINYPGQRGTACGFVEGAIHLKGRTSSLGLPTRIADAGAVRIEGPTKICTGDSVEIYYLRASQCTRGAVAWRVEGSARIVSKDDTSVVVRATGSGTATLVAAAPGACGILTDSLSITVGSIRPLELGGDTALCSGTSVLLDAGPGYSSYRWQDGASTQSYLARGPGIYWVEVSAPDGCMARDTVRIFPDDRDIAVNLGPDTAVCDGTVMMLDAGPGAVRYRWQDGWSERMYTAYQPGKYWVEVTGYCGSAVDTIVVHSGGTSASATVSFDEPSSVPVASGTQITIPLRIDASSDRASLVGYTFQASIRFNATVLLPVGETPHGVILGNERIVTIEDTIGSSDTLALVRFLVMLGDADRTSLTIDTFSIAGYCASAIALVGGTVTVAICETGGARLMSAAGRARLVVQSLMPGGTAVTIRYNLVETGHTRLSVVDALGRRITTLMDDNPGSGEFMLALDSDALASGLYFVVLETPTERLVERLLVRY